MRAILIASLYAAFQLPAAESPVARSWSELESGLQDKSWETRSKAAAALGLLAKSSRAENLARTALDDEREEVRAAAAAALGEIGLRASLPKLKAALNDKSGEVVMASAGALYRLGDPMAYEVYYAVLTKERKAGDGLMADQIKMLHDPKALAKFSFETGLGFIPFAGMGYTAFKMIMKDDETPVRAAAALKLANDKDPESGKALDEAINDKKMLVRVAAIQALVQRKDRRALSAIVPAIDDTDGHVRYTACAAVIALSRVQSVPRPEKGAEAKPAR